ncbi:MAG: lysozyme inhibitor LprI family protein [Sphingorhabdus sp.]
MKPIKIGLAAKVIIASSAILLTAGAVVGKSPDPIKMRYTKTYTACLESREGMSTYGMQNCAETEYDRQDARLNQAYKMVMARQNAAGKTKLRDLQRRWIKNRDAICTEERAEWEGGTGAHFAWKSCMINETIRRIIYLEKYK